jgi:flagellar biosynthetic protein FliQ
MDADAFVSIAEQAMWVMALAAIPILVPALVAGLVLGMIQAATSINEATLSFVPKLAVVALSLALFGAAIMTILADFTRDIFSYIPQIVQ